MKKLFLLTFGVFTVFFASAQNITWISTKSEQISLRPYQERRIIPNTYNTYRMDFGALRSKLNQAPMEMTMSNSTLLLDLPLPDGSLQSFEVFESPVAHQQLMAKYPTFKTFYVIGARDRTYWGRIDYTAHGFHASIDTPEGEVYIDPFATSMTDSYIVYYTKNYTPADMGQRLRCGVTHDVNSDETNHGIHQINPQAPIASARSGGEIVTLRKYRLAMGATGEFTARHGGTKAGALAEIVALTNRVNKKTIAEVAIRFELIPTTDSLIFIDKTKDPFPVGTIGAEVLSRSNLVINQIVGSATFDIGHIMTGNCSDVGGIAGGAACTAGKGSGVTCDSGAGTDNIAISIVCHEMSGHQFTASHTMSACGAGSDPTQVNSSSKIEPGSGSTIMSYDGGCGSDNITGQYFKPNGVYSIGSIGQILNHSRRGNANICANKTGTTNHDPVVTVQHQKKGLVIPRKTPFELTAKGTDSDNDVLKYSWEQSDEGAFLSLGLQNLYSNSFRVFDHVSSPTRTFPRMDNIVKNRTTKDELYPDTSRLYTFVCTARDNNPIAGGISMDTILFRSTHTAGPFLVTFPNAKQDSAIAGTAMLVKWNVANTDNKLVNCQRVNILLSIDGGYNYPTTLLKNTANDGEEYVILPKGLTSETARIRINAVDNIFFDISNQDFSIKSNNNDSYAIAFNSERTKYCLPDTAIFNIQSSALGTFAQNINLSVSGLPTGAIAKFDSESLAPNENTRLIVDLTKVTQQGIFELKLRAIAGTDTTYRTTKFTTTSIDFSTVSAVYPTAGTVAVSALPTFKWTPSPNADSYDVEIATNPSFASNSIIASANNLIVNELIALKQLDENTLYFWRIRAKNGCKAGLWSVAIPFHTVTQVCKDYKSTREYFITSSQAVTINSDLEIVDTGIINDVNVTSIKGTHTNFGELEIRLFSPSGKISLLSDKKCPYTGGTNLSLRYDDQAASINKCDKLLSSAIPFRPETPLSVFNDSDTKGTWRMQIKDLAPGEGGLFQEWGIRLCASTTVAPPSIVVNDTLRVRPTKGRFITDSLLLAKDDKANDNQLTYTLITLPQYGSVERWKEGILSIGATFTQAEIKQRNAIRYVHGNNSASNDFFLFIITDGEGGFVGTLRYNIVISDKAPITGAQDAEWSNSIAVFPNPVQNTLQVQFLDAVEHDTQLQLFNTNGQLVQDMQIMRGDASAKINTNDFTEGIYILKISNPRGFVTRRIVVTK